MPKLLESRILHLTAIIMQANCIDAIDWCAVWTRRHTSILDWAHVIDGWMVDAINFQ